MKTQDLSHLKFYYLMDDKNTHWIESPLGIWDWFPKQRVLSIDWPTLVGGAYKTPSAMSHALRIHGHHHTIEFGLVRAPIEPRFSLYKVYNKKDVKVYNKKDVPKKFHDITLWYFSASKKKISPVSTEVML